MNSIQRKTPVPVVVVALVLICLGCSRLQAVIPAPDGFYPGRNTAEGKNALLNNTSNGIDNTAIGFEALEANTFGLGNTAVGSEALLANTGFNNTAIGHFALRNNTTGSQNTAEDQSTLFYNTTGDSNTANGYSALASNTTGSENTATGLFLRLPKAPLVAETRLTAWRRFFALRPAPSTSPWATGRVSSLPRATTT